ncbi:hypothetical protein IFR05_009575 [Cadophora sp. M221]|nr:hypothetical protein IFR05_009575 [Cadophora sp. M221]
MASRGRVVPGARGALERFKQSISADDAKRIESTELQDVWALVGQIDLLQRVQSTHILSRIDSLVREIGKYSIDGGMFYAGTPWAPYVWAPIKFALQLASKHKDVLEALLSAYTDIGAALPDLDSNIAGYQTAVNGITEVQHVFGSIYSGILEFHHITWKIFLRVHWRQLFYSLWKGSMPKIESIVGSLKQQRDILNAMCVGASSGIEFRGASDQEAERRRNHQSHVQPAEDPVEPRPLQTFEIFDSRNGLAEAGVLHDQCKMCFGIYTLWVAVVVGSLIIGLWRSFATGDEGKGFTDAAYVVAVGGIVVFPIQSRHAQRCKASRRVDD